MGKSSSLKKKRSKNSSQSGMKKKNKLKSRSKSKKTRRQRNDSVSYSTDSDPKSMVSVSSSSSEDDYRSRRSRSRNRKDVKGSRKRARSVSSTSESSEDSPLVKKPKSRRDNHFEKPRKRTSKRKKSRRDVSVSCRSSGSSSCSTSRSDSDEIGHEKRRGRPEIKEKHGRRLEKVKGGSQRSRDRSESRSSFSRYEGSDHSNDERSMEESNSRRLKSVITVVNQENESSRELNTDEPKEEVYVCDDYPSCRSNDTNDDSGRRVLPSHSQVAPETTRPLYCEQGEISNVKNISVKGSGEDVKPLDDVLGNDNALRGNNRVSSAAIGLDGDNMESILRQRALENLRRFRGELQKSMSLPITDNNKSHGDVKTLSSVNTDLCQIKTPKKDDAAVVIASEVRQQIRQLPAGRDLTNSATNNRKTSHVNDDGNGSGTVESEVASLPPAHVVPASVSRVEINKAINSVSSNSKLVLSQARQEAPNIYNSKQQESGAQEPSHSNLVAKSSVSEDGLETAQALKPPNTASVSNGTKSIKPQIKEESPNSFSTQKQESAALEPTQPKLVTGSTLNEGNLESAQNVKSTEFGNSGGKINNTNDSACNKPSSAAVSTSEDISLSDKQEDETKDSSQFQQKTMSVMRGGEMVQVSYQVYIPKRAPALARRQLKR